MEVDLIMDKKVRQDHIDMELIVHIINKQNQVFFSEKLVNVGGANLVEEVVLIQNLQEVEVVAVDLEVEDLENNYKIYHNYL